MKRQNKLAEADGELEQLLRDAETIRLRRDSIPNRINHSRINYSITEGVARSVATASQFAAVMWGASYMVDGDYSVGSLLAPAVAYIAADVVKRLVSHWCDRNMVDRYTNRNTTVERMSD